MVTVPTFTDLAPVAPVSPQVTPQQGVDRVQRADLEKPGEAMQGLGSAVEGAGKEASVIAAGIAQQQNEDAVKKAETQHQGYVNDLLYKSWDGQGGPGLFALKGDDFAKAAPQVQAAIQ